MTADKAAGSVDGIYCRLSAGQRREIKGRGDSRSVGQEKEDERLHRGGFRTMRGREKKANHGRFDGQQSVFICRKRSK